MDMSPTVVVMLPAEVAPPEAQTLVAACTAALRTGQCIVGSDGDADTIAVATVVLAGNDSVHLAVDVRADASTPARHPSRELVFKEADPIDERWKSVGFAIASLSGGGIETSTGEEAPVESTLRTVAPKATSAEPKPASAGSVDRAIPVATVSPPLGRARVNARFETGPGIEGGPWRVGGALGAGYDLGTRVVGLSALVAYAREPVAVSNVGVSWLTLGAGASAALVFFRIEGRIGLSAGARFIRASETDPSTGQEQARSRWLPAGLADLSLKWPADGTLAIFSGVQGVALSGGTAVQSHGMFVGASPAFELGLFVGAELRP
jgi:hypothetical protein